jgi:hypothetical protein
LGKNRARYPRAIRFKDDQSYVAFEKGCLVGHIDIRAGLRDKYGLKAMKLRVDLDEKQVVKLQSWLARWRKSHEANNGPIFPIQDLAVRSLSIYRPVHEMVGIGRLRPKVVE